MKTTTAIRKMMGFTLIELMVALVLGLILIFGVTTMVTNSSSSYRELAKSSAQVENGRYAIQLLMDDLNHAGFYGGYFSPTKFAEATGPSPCATTQTELDKTISLGVQGYLGGSSVPTMKKDESDKECISTAHTYRPNTDILLVRRTATETTSPLKLHDTVNVGKFFFQTHSLSYDGFKHSLAVAQNTCATNKTSFNNKFFAGGTGAVDCTKEPALSNQITCVSSTNRDCFDAGVSGDIRTLVANLYFISNCDICTGLNKDNVPTLKKRELVGNSFSDPISLVRGVQGMRVIYGVDDNDDGQPNRFVKADEVEDGKGYQKWSDVVTIEVFLLVRNEEPTPGYSDTKAYVMGLDATADKVIPGGNFKRHLYRAKIRLNNISNRRL